MQSFVKSYIQNECSDYNIYTLNNGNVSVLTTTIVLLLLLIVIFLQIKYSPRRVKGVGLTDGEGTERLWSFLRDYSRITKEMSSGKRVDVLTDGLLHYATRLRQRFGNISK